MNGPDPGFVSMISASKYDAGNRWRGTFLGDDMRIGVMSDTHGNLAFMQRAADRMIDEFGVGTILHLGDDYADALRLDARGVAVIAVPGIFEAAYKDTAIPRRRMEDFGGFRCLISHTPARDRHERPGDPNPDRARQEGADVLFHGHTHRPRAVKSGDGLITVCPGHLKSADDRGGPPTFLVVDLERPSIVVNSYELDGGLIDSASFEVSS